MGDLAAEAADVVRACARERGATVVDSTAGARWESTMADGRVRLTLTTPSGSYGPVTLGLRGAHQVGNALVAVRLLEVAAARGIAVPRQAIEQGLADAEWPARLELLTIDHGRRVLLDAAHNPEGARALAAYLRRWHPERPPLVLGVMRDKSVADIARTLLPAVSSIIATAAPTPRAIPAANLARHLRAVGAEQVEAEPDPHVAIARALERADTICVAGSIFLAGAVRDRLKQRAILR
jgi:dihydrofolate synthase/folylpolyglutamate synthase